MKFISIITCYIIFESCYGLKASHHYKFNYFSSIKTGIPQGGNQASGVSLKAVLDVYLENQDGIAIFKLSDVRTVVLKDLGNKQETEFPDEGYEPPKDKEISSALEQPFRANLRGSQPFSIEYEETDHRWLSNVRKGIANVFKNEILKGNFDTQENESIASFFHEGHLVNVFSVEEETIFGICKVSYEIHEIKNGFFSPENDFFPTRKNESEEGFWRVVRSVNFDKCKEKVIFNIHTTNEMRKKGEKLKYIRSSVSTYVLQGSPGHFDLYSAIVEGVTTFPLSPFDEQEAHATAIQKLLLIGQTKNEELPTLGPNLKHSTTWMHQVWSSFVLPKDSKPHPWIVYSDENNFDHVNEVYGSKEFTASQISEVKDKILNIIETSSKILTDIDYVTKDHEWQSVPDSLNMVSHYFKMLTKEDILKIFDHIFERRVKLERRLMIDTASSSESHSVFEAIMDYIIEGKLEYFEIRNVFMNLATFDATLNITRLMDYVLQVEIGKTIDTSTVLLNFAHYLSEFCIHKAHNYNPAKEPFKEDCVVVLKRFVLHLKEIIYNETLTWERSLAIRVLQELRTSFAFDVLTPLIDGRIRSSNLLKSMALRALKNWAPDRDWEHRLIRKPVMDLLKDVFTNSKQDFRARSAALLSFISWQPSSSFWYDLAQSTWLEPSMEFSSFASNLIKLYAEGKISALEKQWRDASSALKFAKTPTKDQDFVISSLFDIIFKNYAKISVISPDDKFSDVLGNLIIEILTKEEGHSLLKYESYVMHSELEKELFFYNRTDPHPSKFFETFSNEISLENYPFATDNKEQVFFKVFGDAPNTMPPRMTYNPINLEQDFHYQWFLKAGRFLKLFQNSNFFPNELGLPTFTFSAMPTVFSLALRNVHPDSDIDIRLQILLRASSVYSRGVAVHLPWTQESYSAFVRSSLEFTLPIEIRKKKRDEYDEPIITSKSYLNFVYEKKFPVFRLSNTPMTMVFSLDPGKENPQESLQIIKKFNVEERVISEVDLFTGIKYDLVMKADSKASFGLHDFRRFPKLPFRVWNFEMYINPEESETKELEYVNSNNFEGNFEGLSENKFDSSQENLTISISDTSVEKFKKLIKLFESPVRYFSCKFRFIGEEERSFEAFLAVTQKNVNDGNEKVLLGFTRSPIPGRSTQPASLCVDFSKKTPSRAEKDSAFKTHRNISQEAKLKFLFNCSHPILKAHAQYSMSEEGRAATTEKCNTKYDNTQFYPERKLYFDTIDINASYSTDMESYDFVVTKYLFESLRKWVNLPSIKSYTDKAPDGNFGLKIYRNAIQKNWDLSLKTPSRNVNLATFSDNPLFNVLSGISEFSSDSFFDFLGINNHNDHDLSGVKCTLQGNTVTTFDGVHFSYDPSPCWTLASHTRPFLADTKFSGAFLIRTSKGRSKIPDFKFLLFHSETEIEFSNDELKVNGKVVDRLSEFSPDLKTIEENIIYKSGHHYFIYSRRTSYFSLVIVSNDKIEIYKVDKRRGGISAPDDGICGNKDRKINSEFTGPKFCVYNDAQLFTASWTGQSDNCDVATLKEYRKRVDDFQAACELYQNHTQDVHMNQRCLLFGWKVSTSSENNYCISVKPLPFCLNTCDVIKHESVKVTYKCWPKEKAPDILRTSIKNKIEIVGDPVSADPYFYEHFYTDVATLCKKTLSLS